MADLHNDQPFHSQDPSDLSQDLISLDDTLTPSTGGSQDSILNAAQVFEAQLEQMTTWKHQLAQQMEVLRRDGIKLLERQKNLAIERKKLADERAQVTSDRQYVQKLHRDLQTETDQLGEKQSQLELAQAALEATAQHLNQREAELTARQNSLQEQENRFLSQDVQLKSTLEQLEQQRLQLCDAQRQLQQDQQNLSQQQQNFQAETAGQQTDLQNRRAALEARTVEIAALEQAAAAQSADLTTREQQLQTEKQDFQNAQSALTFEQQRLGALEAELITKNNSSAQSQTELQQERETLAADRRKLEQRIETLEQEYAEQLESLAKQSRRLVERRAEMDAKSPAAAPAPQQPDLTPQYEAQLTDLRNQLTAAQQAASDATTRETQLRFELDTATRQIANQKPDLTPHYEAQLADLRAQLTAAQQNATDLTAKEAQLRSELDTATRQIAAQLPDPTPQFEAQLADLRAQLATAQQSASDFTTRESQLRTELDTATRQIAAQLPDPTPQFEAQLTDLRNQLAAAQQSANDWSARETQLRTELDTTSQQVAALQLDLTRTAAELVAAERVRSDLAARFAQQEEQHTQEIDTLQNNIQQSTTEKLTSARQSHEQNLVAAQNQLLLLEQQRNDLMQQVVAGQDALRRQTEEAVLAQNALKAQIANFEQIISTLEAEKSAWHPPQSQPAPTPQVSRLKTQDPTAPRARLIRQARTIRAYRKQMRESKSTLEQGRTEIAQQREQLRVRKDNLEQVKRLLEKQEMVMARKLADHNALKTVAAVGIFVIMILGSVFFGVYRFVNPNYKAEAIVQLAPPQDLQGAQLQKWLADQADFVRNPEVTFAAWKILRMPDEHYSMQDVREEWIGSLPKNLEVQTDPSTHTLSIQYTGLNPEGVAQVANALAASLAAPTSRESTPQTITIGQGANVIAKATTPSNPVQDSRLMISLSLVAISLFVSLILVILFRHYVARQLREIDDMADEKDLEDIASDMPPEASPT